MPLESQCLLCADADPEVVRQLSASSLQSRPLIKGDTLA